MVGTGVFATLGYQLLEFDSGFLLLLLWLTGGVAAFCGALCYAELGALFPRSGGEYNFLGRIYHPAAGFVSGWLSATIGFAAPSAAVAIAFGAYLAPILGEGMPGFTPKLLACALIVALAFAHARNRSSSSAVQLVFTALKIITILGLCAGALLFGSRAGDVGFVPSLADVDTLTSGAFAVALVYVSYAYTGWNAATYLTGELKNPGRDLPRVLIAGTLVVTALYLALNFVFLVGAPASALRGETEIAYIAARYLFGEGVAQVTGLVIATLLVSTVSAMTMAGPRVLHAIGEDFRLFRALGARNKAGVPARAIYVQAAIALGFILTSSFQFILVFASFAVALNSFLAVLGVFVARVRFPLAARSFSVPLFPLPPLIYLALTGWMLVFVLIEQPGAAFSALGLIGLGLLVYLFAGREDRQATLSSKRVKGP